MVDMEFKDLLHTHLKSKYDEWGIPAKVYDTFQLIYYKLTHCPEFAIALHEAKVYDIN